MRRRRYPEGASAMLLGLGALRAGAITFAEFERRTRRDWDRIARELHSRWVLPVAVSVEDVRQELLLAVVVRKASSQGMNLLEKWNPRRRTPLDEYVVWNARVAAARWIHKQRGATRNREEGDVAGKIKSKFFPVISTLGTVSDRSDTVREVEVPGCQEAVLILGQEVLGGLRDAEQSCRVLEVARQELVASIRRAGRSSEVRSALRAELRWVTQRLRVPRQVVETASELLEAQGRIGAAVAVRSRLPAGARATDSVAGMVRARGVSEGT